MSTRVLRIDAIAAGGDGVARDDGLAVFVPRTAPGDEVEAEVEQHGRLGRGEWRTLRTASPDRVAPACRHYDGDQCGGCQLQHMSYAAQLTAKKRIVEDAMARLARRPVTVSVLHPSPQPWAYRARLTLTIRQQHEGVVIGLRHRTRPDDVFQLSECPITEPAIVAAWRDVQLAATLLPRARTLSGVMRRDGAEISFQLNGGDAWPRSAEFIRACPTLARVTWRPVGGRERTVHTRTADASPLGAFQQVNPAVARQLHQAVVERALAFRPASLVDAYAGSGATALPLARAGVRVCAIEWDRAAVEHLTMQLTEGSVAVCARVEDALADRLPADVVLLNPPREGVHRRVGELLSAQPPRAVVYVSCDPATLARDLTRLVPFEITHLEAFDMFPQTAHVETLCVLERSAA